MDKTVLFYWSKGASTRVRILFQSSSCQKKKGPCFLSQIAGQLRITHVAAKKHVDLLVEGGYLREINPNGKPVFLELTEKGKQVLAEFKNKKWSTVQ